MGLETEIVGPDIAIQSSIEVRNSGTVVAPQLTALTHCDLTLDATAGFPIEQITTFTRGRLEVTGFAPDLSGWTDVDDISLRVTGSGEIELSTMTTYQTDRSRNLVAIGESRVALPNVIAMSGPVSGTGAPKVIIQARNGSRVELPQVAQMNGGFTIEAINERSIVDLSSLQSMESTANYPSLVTAEDGGQLQLTAGTLTASNTQITLTEAGSILGGTLALGLDSTLRGVGTLSAHVVNGGAVELNDAEAPMVVDGNFTMQNDGVFFVTLGLGENNDSAGQLQVTGTAQLAGILQINQHFRFVPEVDDEVLILSCDTVSGNFDQIEGTDLGDGFMAEVQSTPEGVVIRIVQQ
jgi:hypothetical protein